MINTRVVVSNSDGSVSIVVPAPEMFDAASTSRQLVPELDGKTDEEILQHIIDKSVPKDKTYRIITTDELPADRFFRNAWTDDNKTNTVDVDIEKAKEIKKEQFRELRKPLLEQLDCDFMRALEVDADTSGIVAAKQELRDVTSVELPTDVEALKDFLPDVLA